MATYQAQISWMKDHPPMDYLQKGDWLQIRGTEYRVELLYRWNDRLVVETEDRKSVV